MMSWSVPLRLSELAHGPVTRTLEPDEPTRRALARELDLVELPALNAEVTVSPWLDGVRLEGAWTAQVVQTCGVTLEPLASDLRGRISVRAVPQGSPAAPQLEDGEVALEPEAEDPPDVLESDRIDLAAYLVEHVALEIDPYPRKPGVEFEPPPSEPETSPFAVLAQLKPRDAT